PRRRAWPGDGPPQGVTRLPCPGPFAKRHPASVHPRLAEVFVSITVAVFYLLAAITVGSALGVAFANSIIYSAFALMGTLLGVAAMFVLLGADFLGAVRVAGRAHWVVKDVGAPAPTTYGIGNAFLSDYVLPFEIASLVLLAALIGA